MTSESRSTASALDVGTLEQRVRRLSGLLDAMHAISSELDLDRLLQVIVRKVTETMDAERGSLFLLDRDRDEIWSKVAQGSELAEIRFPNGVGLAGSVVKTGEIINIPDAYEDPRFNPAFDKQTGYRTRTILCMPLINREGLVTGCVQVLNKRSGVFDSVDEELLAALNVQVVLALENAQLLNEVNRRMRRTDTLLTVMNSLSSELELDRLLQRIMQTITDVMMADRSTLYLVDEERGEIWSKVVQGEGMGEIRVPIGRGIAGTVAATGEIVNIPEAYDDPRFNPAFDRATGYRTKTILCMPMRDERGRIVGVTQVLNKQGGIFTRDDENLLAALSSQANIALKNARLFEEVIYMKNYNESILRSMATGVITMDLNRRVVVVNPAAQKILEVGEDIVGLDCVEAVAAEPNKTLRETILKALEERREVTAYEVSYVRQGGDTVMMNVNVLPLTDSKGNMLGAVLVVDDITKEQRLMSTLVRYVSREVAEQALLNQDLMRLGGVKTKVTVLFSDIRGFTTISERLDAEQVVSLLNEYFSRMVSVIFAQRGTLDKYIGDAVMAVFGAPIPLKNSALAAILAAVEMRRELRRLNEERIRRGEEPIENGVGVSNGEALTGNIGSEQRMDYTVIGDAVNVASRLEGVTKLYDCKIIFNDRVYQDIVDQIPCVDLGFEKVKGREKAVRLYGIPDSMLDEIAELHLMGELARSLG